MRELGRPGSTYDDFRVNPVSAISRRSGRAASWQVSNDAGARDEPVNVRMLTHLVMGTQVQRSAAASEQTVFHAALVRPSPHGSGVPA